MHFMIFRKNIIKILLLFLPLRDTEPSDGLSGERYYSTIRL